jgi:hypothetical protein
MKSFVLQVAFFALSLSFVACSSSETSTDHGHEHGTETTQSSTAASKPADDHGHDHSTASGTDHHAGDTATLLGEAKAGEWSVTAAYYGAPKAGKELDVDVKADKLGSLPKTLRAWIGSESAEETGKTLLEASGHGHLPVPDPLTAPLTLWVEVEDEAGKHRAKLEFPAEAAATHDHEHDHSDHSHEH